jgi:hypothetical protein
MLQGSIPSSFPCLTVLDASLTVGKVGRPALDPHVVAERFLNEWLAWARHVSEDAAEGQPITAETVGREAIDTAGYAFGAVRGPVTIAEGLDDLGDDVFGQLERAAREWDGLKSVPD